MRPIHHLTARLLLCLAALLTVTACQDDYIEKNAGTTGEGDKTTLRLIVPMTRATSYETSDATSDEAKVTSLWLLAYPVVDSEGETLVQKLNTNTDQLTHDYKDYSVEIKLGTYHMYVVANVPEINYQTTAKYSDEDELKALLLKYKDEANNSIVLPSASTSGNGLPMVCEYQNIKTTADGDDVGTDGITIDKATTVYANLTFACVKVRYTLVFDNKGVSSDAFAEKIVQIKKIEVAKVPQQAQLILNGTQAEKPYITTDGTPDGEPQTIDNTPTNPYYFNAGSAFTSSTTSEEYDTFFKGATAETNFDEAQGSSYAYRGTLYLPEHYVTAEDQRTELRITAKLLLKDGSGGYIERADLKYTIPLCNDIEEAKESTSSSSSTDGDATTGDATALLDNVFQLPRGYYHDIIARITTVGNDLEITAAVQTWDTETVSAELNGPYFLQVEETSIELTASDTVTVACQTDAPLLEYDSPKYSLNGKEIDAYIVEFQRDETTGEYTSFTVHVNPEIPAMDSSSDEYQKIGKYIYIIANGLWKKIEISPLNLDPYLIVSPASYTVYMKEISNLATYTVTFYYSTNLDNIQITCNEKDHTGTAQEGHITYDGLQPEFTPVTNGKGTVTCTLNKPYDQTCFPENEEITFTYTATYANSQSFNGGEQTTILKIVPNATTYRLHFRPLQYIWTNPHIYVYEPLYDKDGNLVYVTGGTGKVYEGTESDGTPAYDGENALMYSFTGKRTFLGWSSHGGIVTDPVTYKEVNGKKYWDGPDAALKYLSIDAHKVHTWEIDYSKDFRDENICYSCCIATPKGHNQYGYSGLSDGYNYKWPGVSMKKDPDNPGWFYYDLPLLAEPGKALIMFTEGHNGPDENLSDDEKKKRRYPAHMDPGVPLYNFADKDGWFLYDYTKNQHEFIDDKPDYTCRIYIKTSLTFKAVHIWEENGSDHTKWPGIEVNFDGEKYYVDIPRILSDINTKRVGILCTDGQSNNVSQNNFIEINSFTDVRASHLKYDYVADIEITQ